MKEIRKIHYSKIEEILGSKLVIHNRKLYATKEDLRFLPEFITLLEIPEFKENNKEVRK